MEHFSNVVDFNNIQATKHYHDFLALKILICIFYSFNSIISNFYTCSKVHQYWILNKLRKSTRVLCSYFNFVNNIHSSNSLYLFYAQNNHNDCNLFPFHSILCTLLRKLRPSFSLSVGNVSSISKLALKSYSMFWNHLYQIVPTLMANAYKREISTFSWV